MVEKRVSVSRTKANSDPCSPVHENLLFPFPRSSGPLRAVANRMRLMAWDFCPGFMRSPRGSLVVALVVVAGCSGRSSVLTGGASTGQMKTSLSHLQFENEQLKTEVAKLREESRSFEDRLVQEQVHNGDLAARLDDARNLLRDRGIENDTRLGATTRGSRAADQDDELSGPRAIPAGRSSRKPRKPPSASIPGGDLDDLPTASDDALDNNDTISLKAGDSPKRQARFSDDPARSPEDEDQLRWQPVATTHGPQSTPRR